MPRTRAGHGSAGRGSVGPADCAGPVAEATDADGIGAGDARRPPSASARRGSLWRDRNFLTMWSGQAFSQFGAQITELAIPVLAVLLLNATEFEVGVLNAAGVAAFLVVGLPAGAWIDRMRKRHVMIWADAVRAVALARSRCCGGRGAADVAPRTSVALVMGVATVFFDVSYQSIVPSLVRPSQIAEANGKLQSTYELANIAGPGIGGWLIGIAHRPARDPRDRRHLPGLVRRAAVHPRPRGRARAGGPRADPARDRRGPALGVRQAAAAPHRRHHRCRRTSSARSR